MKRQRRLPRTLPRTFLSAILSLAFVGCEAGTFAPRLGQHTREILAEAGYSPAEIDDMAARKIAFPERRA